MYDYNFQQLNDREFEQLSADLLSIKYKTNIEIFKGGRDGGVDGRFFSNTDEEIIIQCKHYLKTSYSGLKSKLKSEEVKKVKKLNPQKYIFVTSQELSRDNKKEIKDIFSPYIKRDDDIFGREDLNKLLFENKEIEKKYYKLWLNSTHVLENIFNNSIKGRSEFLFQQITREDKINKYVFTDNHNKAKDKLIDKNVLIISGEPGIGKTTLANNIALDFLIPREESEETYELIEIQDPLNEAESIWEKDKKQLFYYDDFLGSNYLELLEGKKDSHIINFIKRVSESKNKLFILTSRTNILVQGKLFSDKIRQSNTYKNEFLLTIKSLNEIDKAWILYNHIFFSNLDDDYIDKIYENKKYRKITKHSNFNPRLIEFIIDKDRIEELSINPENYWKYIKNTLDNPAEIWSGVFYGEKCSNEYIRGIIKLVVYNGGSIREEDLRNAYDNFVEAKRIINDGKADKSFNSVIKPCVGSFLNRNIDASNGDVTYKWLNPSLGDFVLNDCSSDNKELVNIFSSLQTIDSVKEIKSLEYNKIVTKKSYTQIINQVWKLISKDLMDNDYILEFLKLFESGGKNEKIIIDTLKGFVEEYKEISNYYDFLSLLYTYGSKIDIKSLDFLIEYLEQVDLDSELEYVIEILDDFYKNNYNDFESFKKDNEKLLELISNNIESLLEEELSSSIGNFDIMSISFENFVQYDAYSEYGAYEIIIDKEGIYDEIVDNIYYDPLFGKVFIENLNIDYQSIVRNSSLDIDQIVKDYLKDLEDSDYEPDIDHRGGGSIDYSQDIDDIFYRD
ncbi:MAG: CpaF/VirB11 family protein [Candidatus Gracilibacteria bacterium]|nr:CpaF/VirB11 family protein [Candidatus Gracilibacteria bacterium]